MRLIGCDALVVVQRLSNRSVNLLVDGFRKLLRGKEHLIRVIHVCVLFLCSVRTLLVYSFCLPILAVTHGLFNNDQTLLSCFEAYSRTVLYSIRHSTELKAMCKV